MIRKTILVTGATKGIGLATTEWLTQHKHQVIGIARNASQAFPGKLFLCDLSDAEQTEQNRWWRKSLVFVDESLMD